MKTNFVLNQFMLSLYKSRSECQINSAQILFCSSADGVILLQLTLEVIKWGSKYRTSLVFKSSQLIDWPVIPMVI